MKRAPEIRIRASVQPLDHHDIEMVPVILQADELITGFHGMTEIAGILLVGIEQHLVQSHLPGNLFLPPAHLLVDTLPGIHRKD